MLLPAEFSLSEKSWPFPLTPYNRNPALKKEEKKMLANSFCNLATGKINPVKVAQSLARLWPAIKAVLIHYNDNVLNQRAAVKILLLEMHQRQSSFWAWTEEDWIDVLQNNSTTLCAHRRIKRSVGKSQLLALAYLLGSFRSTLHVGLFNQIKFAYRIFGEGKVRCSITTLAKEMVSMGLSPILVKKSMPRVLCHALLFNRSPFLSDLSLDVLQQMRNQKSIHREFRACVPISRALVNLGFAPHPLKHATMGPRVQVGKQDTVSGEWLIWCRRWYSTSTLAKITRQNKFSLIVKIGRWLAQAHPAITTPAQWTRLVASECVAAVNNMVVGQFMHPLTNHVPELILGKPLLPNSKAVLLAAIRTFFIDCQDWKWVPVTFDPRRCLATPPSINALREPNPRIVADDVWAKLLSAGLSLTAEDLPVCTYQINGSLKTKSAWYPLELVRAVVFVWLFAGLRANEVSRLRVGCVRWQQDLDAQQENQNSEGKAVCLLSVPVSKTNSSFVKPVDRLVGEAIEAWESVRPSSARQLDLKTGELVDFLFVFRAKRIGKGYINSTIIPMLCRKAGVPEKDAGGNITSHRARSTIATQLYNAKEPLSLFELQEWLGHRQLSSTQYYAKVTPAKLTKAYEKAGYFEQNLRTISVLIDQDVIKSGAAGRGEPWKFYDLGHGYCTYDFFDQCPHRMACAKCSFYKPKESTQAQLLEGKTNLQRMLQEIPLTEDEREAVEDGLQAIQKLYLKLKHVPTPSGLTPTQISDSH